jgi:hypothetical protein
MSDYQFSSKEEITSSNTCRPIQNTKKAHSSSQPIKGINVECGSQSVILPAPAVQHEIKKDCEGFPENVFNYNQLIHDVIWPSLVIFLFLLTYRKLLEIIENTLSRIKKLKHSDTELEFLSKEANDSLARLAHDGYSGVLNIDAVFETVKFNEWATVIMGRMLLRKMLVELIKNTLHNQSLPPSPSLKDLIRIAKENNLLPSELIGNIEKLRQISYFAEWWGGDSPTHGDWKWAVRNAKPIIEAIYDHHSLI